MIFKYINKMSNIQALCYPWHVLFTLNIYIVSVKKIYVSISQNYLR